MILEEKYIEKVKKYCEINNIPIKGGMFPAKYAEEIKNYIKASLHMGRQVTAGLEASLSLRLEHSLGGIMRQMSGNVMESPIEEYLWDALKKAELSFIACRQFEIGPYRIDIAFPNAHLAIECDGAEYHRENQLQLERDQKRDKYLARKGWRTLRIEGIAIRRDINYCIERIKNALGDFSPPIPRSDEMIIERLFPTY